MALSFAETIVDPIREAEAIAQQGPPSVSIYNDDSDIFEDVPSDGSGAESENQSGVNSSAQDVNTPSPHFSSVHDNFVDASGPRIEVVGRNSSGEPILEVNSGTTLACTVDPSQFQDICRGMGIFSEEHVEEIVNTAVQEYDQRELDDLNTRSLEPDPTFQHQQQFSPL